MKYNFSASERDSGNMRNDLGVLSKPAPQCYNLVQIRPLLSVATVVGPLQPMQILLSIAVLQYSLDVNDDDNNLLPTLIWNLDMYIIRASSTSIVYSAISLHQIVYFSKRQCLNISAIRDDKPHPDRISNNFAVIFLIIAWVSYSLVVWWIPLSPLPSLSLSYHHHTLFTLFVILSIRPFLICNLLAFEEFIIALTVFITAFLSVDAFNIRSGCKILPYIDVMNIILNYYLDIVIYDVVWSNMSLEIVF